MREHPQIERALATGYPEPLEEPTCCRCGDPATAYHLHKGYMCTDCARYQFEYLNDEAALELLGFEVLE